MPLSKKDINKQLSVIHPNVYLDRLGEKLKTDGGKIVDYLFEIAGKAGADPKVRIKAIQLIADLTGLKAYMAGIGAAAAKSAAGPEAPEGDDDDDSLDSEVGERFRVIAEGGAAGAGPAEGPGQSGGVHGGGVAGSPRRPRQGSQTP